MKVLVINAGSSSLKYQLLDTESGEVMAKGLCERIGIDGVLTHTGNKSDEKFKFDIAMPTHKEAIQSVINVLLDPEKGVISSMSEIDAVGHRVVHGGEFFTDSVIITEKVLKAIEDCVPLAPLHNPPNLIGIQACREVMGPDVPMVAVLRHRVPPDHAAGALHVCDSPMSIMRSTRSAATASTAPAISMFPSRLQKCSAVRSRSCA